MNPIIKIMVGALMVVIGVYSTETFLTDVLTLLKAGIGPLLVVVGAFIVWLESDEWKMRKEKESQESYQEQFNVEKQESEPETGTTQQDVKQAVESERHVCDECDREFDTKRGLSIHQSQMHE